MEGVAGDHAEPEQTQDQGLKKGLSSVEAEGKPDEEEEEQGDESLQGNEQARMRGLRSKRRGQYPGNEGRREGDEPGKQTTVQCSPPRRSSERIH